MAKLTNAELTAITQDELEKLAEEVRQRTKATITGVKIPDLTEAQQADGTEFIIIETATETKKVSLANIPIKEVVDARDDGNVPPPATLKERLDKMHQDLKTEINGLVKVYNEIRQEINVSVPTANRPVNPSTGMCVFDTDLNKPIWWSGTNWVDATGQVV